MDALVKATIESLKKILPQLQKELEKNYPSQSAITESPLPGLLMEAHELIDLLMQRTYTEETGEESNANRPSIFVTENEARKKDSPHKNSPSTSVSDDLSDEDAIAMMREMDEQPLSATDDMDDERARKLLADMDSPTESASDDMDDDEARRLLAEMDGGQADSEMDDDEAKRLLMEMEGPSTSEPSAPQKTVSTKSSQTPAATPIHTDHADDHNDDELVEINEWEENEFQSDPTMLADFITNSDELMQTLDASILRLEQEPTNKEIIEEIFRSAHTLKGAAGMFGFKGLERVMHRLENLFDLIRKDKLVPNSDMIDTVFQGLDMLRTLLQAVKDGKPCGVATVPVVHALSLAAKGQVAPKKAGAVAKTSDAHASPSASPHTEREKEKREDVAKEGKAKKERDKRDSKEQSTIRVDLERLDVLVNLVGELVIDRSRFASIEEDLRNNHPEIKLGSNFSETVQLFGRHMNEIQDIIMKVRMVPIGNAFNKFTRLVRDLSRSLDKKIDLAISGEDAELDKTLVEQIGDPLIHLIRNSCDHGIEMPADRLAKGKDSQGTILLSAAQEGNNIVIKIEDDGKGMDPAYIRKKAVEKGLISDDTTLNERDSLALIFEPGFSTADKVTELSGRGVGMDVVKKQIMKLKGSIDLDSKPGRGTKTTIRLPLTLAIVQSLLVRSQGEVFAIPLNSVIESIRISPKEIQKVGETSVYKLRETVLPLVQLDEAMALNTKEGSIADLWKRNSPKPRQRADRLFVVVVGHPDRPTGIIVDQLLNQQEMVIKPMGPLMRHIPCVAGGAVLGQGEVVLVLDVPELEAISRGRSRYQAA